MPRRKKVVFEEPEVAEEEVFYIEQDTDYEQRVNHIEHQKLRMESGDDDDPMSAWLNMR